MIRYEQGAARCVSTVSAAALWHGGDFIEIALRGAMEPLMARMTPAVDTDVHGLSHHHWHSICAIRVGEAVSVVISG